MKQLFTILLITLISCTSNPAPTEEVVKQDTVKPVIVADTTKKFKVSSRALAIEEPLTKAEIVNLVNYQVAQQMAAIPDQNWVTMRKDIGFLVDEIDRLTSENLAKNDIIMALQDTIKNFHYLWVDPLIGETVRGVGVDSLIKNP